MKFFRILLFFFIGLLIIILIIAGVVKKTYSTEREVIINIPKQTVFSYIKHLGNLNKYSKWATMDESIQYSYKGNDGEAGFVYSWESDADGIGKGSQEITTIKEGERVESKIHIEKPFETNATSYFITDSIAPNKTKLKWGIIGKIKYPTNALLLVMNIDKIVGNDLGVGLDNLKVLLEKEPISPPLK